MMSPAPGRCAKHLLNPASASPNRGPVLWHSRCAVAFRSEGRATWTPDARELRCRRPPPRGSGRSRGRQRPKYLVRRGVNRSRKRRSIRDRPARVPLESHHHERGHMHLPRPVRRGERGNARAANPSLRRWMLPSGSYDWAGLRSSRGLIPLAFERSHQSHLRRSSCRTPRRPTHVITRRCEDPQSPRSRPRRPRAPSSISGWMCTRTPSRSRSCQR